MNYALEDVETTHYSAHLPHELTIKTVQKRFVPADGAVGDVYTEQLPSGRRRSFLLERITIRWELRSDRSGVHRRITGGGRTVLASGEISSRSRGYASFGWSRQPAPDDLLALATEHDPWPDHEEKG